MKKKEILDLKIEDMSFGGKSFAKVEDRKVHFKGGITGQKVQAFITKVRKDKAEAKIMNIIEKSPLETEDTCAHFGKCGGCLYLAVEYKNQLSLKEKMVHDLFENAGFNDLPFEEIMGSALLYHYRNKMEYTFGNEEKGGIINLGMHKKGRSFDIINIEDCLIGDLDYQKILNTTISYFRDKNIAHYNKVTHEGFLRHLVVRKGFSTGEILINICTSSQIDFDFSEYINLLNNLSLNGNIVGILRTLNDNIADTITCERLDLLFGRDHIFENLLGLKFKISAFSFFQTNSKAAEQLYEVVRDFVGDSDNKVVFDLYCGTGTIGQIVASKAKKVIGIEIIEEAIDSAIENANLNNISNCHFIAQDVAKAIKDLNDKPDIIIVDPPRTGIHPKALVDIIAFNAPEIVYVSCNPKTLVDDLKGFLSAGYIIDRIKPVDMFPHTPHVETVCLLTR